MSTDSAFAGVTIIVGIGSAFARITNFSRPVNPLAPFMAFLGLDRKRRNGARIKAFQADGIARLFAIAVSAIVDPLQGRFNLGNEFALPVTRPKLKGAVGFRRGPVRQIRQDMILVLQMGDGFPAFAQDVFLPGIQLLPEIRRLPFIHERLVVTGFIVDIDK